MLDFVNPIAASGRSFDGAWQARFTEVGKGTQTPQHGRHKCRRRGRSRIECRRGAEPIRSHDRGALVSNSRPSRLSSLTGQEPDHRRTLHKAFPISQGFPDYRVCDANGQACAPIH